MWEKRRCGMEMGEGGGEMWVWIFALWHERQERDQRLRSRDMCGHTKREEMRRRVALIPGWPREWMWSKTWRRKERGTRGRKVEVEMSPKRERS